MHLPGIPAEIHDFPSVENIRLRGGTRWKLRNTLVQDTAALEELRQVVRKHRDLAYDTEGSGLNPHMGARICGHSVTVPGAEHELLNWYVPVRHQNSQEAQIDPAHAADVFKDIFSTKPRTRGHHVKFDASMAYADGINLEGPWEDTSLKAIIFDENEPSFGLKKLIAKHIYPAARDEEDVLIDWMRKEAHQLKLPFRKRSKKDPTMPTYLERYGYARSPVPMCGIYACHDTAYTWLLDDFYTPQITAYPQVLQRETAISHHLFEMEWNGMPIDVSQIRRTDALVSVEVEHWRGVIKGIIKRDIDLTDANLRKLFYEEIGFDVPKMTPSETSPQPSVDKEARNLLGKKYPEWAPFMDALSSLASAEKLRSTYAGSWLRYVTPMGKVHSSYNQLEQRDEGGVPRTGRLGSSNPNAQNVAKKPLHLTACACPKCAEKKKIAVGEPVTVSIRRYYTVPDGFVRAFFDLSQIELRVLAWFSRDPVLLNCYANDLDVHDITAKAVTDGDRDNAKRVNFGNNYGQGAYGLARLLPHYAEDPERAIKDAERFLRLFFETYAGVPIYRRDLANHMRENDCMFINPFGRPRRIPEIDSDDKRERAAGERKMMASIISGTAADVIKEIMLRVSVVLREEYGHQEKKGHQVQTIHDENIYDLPINGVGPVLHKIHKCFTNWPMFEDAGVPIRCGVELSTTTWEDKKAIELLPGGQFRWAA